MATTPQSLKQRELLIQDVRTAETLLVETRQALNECNWRMEKLRGCDADSSRFPECALLLKERERLENHLSTAEVRHQQAKEALEAHKET
ncbi:MAG: hypothetical protein AAB552_01290 [Patescibacteria group bacterium]